MEKLTLGGQGIMGKKKKCNCWDEHKKRCGKELYIILRVQVYHPNSLRHSWQTWYLCKEHFSDLKNVKGEGWGCSYRNNSKPFAPLVQYNIL